MTEPDPDANDQPGLTYSATVTQLAGQVDEWQRINISNRLSAMTTGERATFIGQDGRTIEVERLDDETFRVADPGAA